LSYSGVASKLIALQKLADSPVEDFPSKSFWLPFDDDWWRWCRTRPEMHVTLRCPRSSLLTAPTCPVKIGSCPSHSENVKVRTISFSTQTLT